MASSTKHSRCDICNIVKLKGIARIWRKLAGGGEKKLPRDVPPGHLAVVVGGEQKRLVIRADYLNHPIFKQLLDQAYEEYGHQKRGPLTIPCDEFCFQDIIHSVRRGTNVSSFFFHEAEEKLGLRSWKDSTALLQGFPSSSAC